MADVTLIREIFYKEVFEPYNRAVKNGKYKKISYNIWRTIRDWCCDHKWTDYYIGITPVLCGYHIMLEPYTKVCPEVITVAFNLDLDSPAFAEYLRDHRTEIASKNIKTFNGAFKQMAITTDTCKSAIQSLQEAFHTYDTNTKEKEKNMKFNNFDFGPVNDAVHLSMYGMAIRNAEGTYVAYDTKTKNIMDVDILNFPGANKFMYKMPVALKDVRAGDCIIHAHKPMFVTVVRTDGRLNVLDIFNGEEKTVVPTRSPFNFDFITKVVSLIDVNGTATADNPFGAMLPLLMMSDNNTDFNDMLPLLLFTQNNKMQQNPMMLYALMKNNTDMLPFLMAMNQPVNYTTETD